MAANSIPRLLAKKVLAPLLTESTYSLIQAAAMGWDIRRGAWHEPELELIDAIVRPGDVAIDIGANFGLWAHYLSRRVGDSGKVYSFEPIPFTARTFRHLLRAFRWRNVELVEKGCGERSERVTFSVPVMDTGAISAGLVHMKGRNDARPGQATYAAFPKTKDVDCDVVALDDYLPTVMRPGARVSLLKCDIEGADLFAMRGAKKLLLRDKPVVIMEITPWFLEGFGLTAQDVVQYMIDLGYELYRYEATKLVAASAEDVVEDNWVFVHKEGRARVASLLA